MSRPWMPFYVADYIRDTRRLTPAEHGAYLHLILEYWTSGELPDDDRQLARIAGMTTAEWRRARPNVQVFFHDGWKHKRIDAELARSAEISSKRAASAKLKHSKSSANAPANAEQLDTHARASSQPQSQPQEQKSSRAVALDDGWPENFGDLFWQAYPRKTEKLSAMKKLATVRKSGVVTWPDLLAGVNRYAAAVKNNDPKFTKHPTTWLNAGCWADETQPGADHGQRHHTGQQQRRPASADFFDGILSVAKDLAGNGEPSRPAGEEIPRGRVEIDG